MATTEENNVKRENQVTGSLVYFLGKPGGKRVLIFGNSITRHAPKSEIGWSGDYGMAASCKEKDYVHVLYSEMEKRGWNPYFLVSQAAAFEADFFKENALDFLSVERDFQPDILLLRLGDNIYPFEDEKLFLDAFRRLIGACKTDHTKVVVTGSYFVNPPIEPYLIDLCKTGGYVYVKLDDISLSEENWGEKEKFTHDGVRKHPGDRGMSLIADRIFAAIDGAIKGGI